MVREEEREKVLVPVRRCDVTHQEELIEKPEEEKPQEMPRRWYVY